MPSTRKIWEAKRGGDGPAPPRLKDLEDPSRVHLSRKVWERIRNHYFIDIFILLSLEAESRKTGTK